MHRLNNGSRFSARSIRRSASAVIAATALVGTLTACSSDDSNDAAASSSETTSAMTSTATNTSKAPAPSSEAPKPEDKDKNKDKDKDKPAPPPAPAPAPEGNQPPAPNDAPQPVPGPIDANATPPAPVQGSPANDGDKQQIRGLLGKLENGNQNAREYYRTILNSTCQAQLDKHPEAFSPGQVNQIPEIPMSTQPGLIPQFSDVKDYTVNGDDASATVTVSANGKTETSTMRFKREGGQWKFCS